MTSPRTTKPSFAATVRVCPNHQRSRRIGDDDDAEPQNPMESERLLRCLDGDAPRPRCTGVNLFPVARSQGRRGMTTAGTVRRRLVNAAGEALCDSCLARACSVSLSEMRRVTEELLTSASYQHRDCCIS